MEYLWIYFSYITMEDLWVYFSYLPMEDMWVYFSYLPMEDLWMYFSPPHLHCSSPSHKTTPLFPDISRNDKTSGNHSSPWAYATSWLRSCLLLGGQSWICIIMVLVSSNFCIFQQKNLDFFLLLWVWICLVLTKYIFIANRRGRPFVIIPSLC